MASSQSQHRCVFGMYLLLYFLDSFKFVLPKFYSLVTSIFFSWEHTVWCNRGTAYWNLPRGRSCSFFQVKFQIFHEKSQFLYFFVFFTTIYVFFNLAIR
jgi:hypothetical protein